VRERAKPQMKGGERCKKCTPCSYCPLVHTCVAHSCAWQSYAGSGRQPIRLTPAFVDRMFEEIGMFKPENGPGSWEGGEMDYKSFLDFVLAMENKKTKEGLSYLFRLLDVKRVGYLDSFAISYFFRDIIQILRDNGFEAASLEDVKDEIFDMVKPKDPLRITLEDLIVSKCGGTVVEMLIDINGFWAYDHRESLVWEENEEEEENWGAQGGQGGQQGEEEEPPSI